ncbi:unnamed protein product [Ambrosiozyma monospora]|uniref:Unnamed protein product n=1 Tax=Ambrosiozyma monospora TaxID=43982 RepID=A0ACB5U0A7_AMBMO|nr:unnamed protein product [Ambrosiozyma monospora]
MAKTVNGSTKSNPKSLVNKKKKKQPRKFNMPDNVPTGFRSVTELLKKKGAIDSLADEMKANGTKRNSTTAQILETNDKPKKTKIEKKKYRLEDEPEFDDSESDDEETKLPSFSQMLSSNPNSINHSSQPRSYNHDTSRPNNKTDASKLSAASLGLPNLASSSRRSSIVDAKEVLDGVDVDVIEDEDDDLPLGIRNKGTPPTNKDTKIDNQIKCPDYVSDSEFDFSDDEPIEMLGDSKRIDKVASDNDGLDDDTVASDLKSNPS